MIKDIQEQETRRLGILEGIKNGLGNVKIAARLGIPLLVVIKDLKRMRHNRDPELVQAYVTALDQARAKKQSVAELTNDRFYHMTGMILTEKTFSNMMSFYRPEIMKILKSDVEGDAIRQLPSSVRRILKHNGIIAQNSPQISSKAHAYLSTNLIDS
jgi:hypothetical protein